MSERAHAAKWRAEAIPETGLWTLRCDGSCRPNPGPMGIGYSLSRGDYPPIIRVGAQLGRRGTNNIAEYEALLAGMRHALRVGMWKLTVLVDSNLLMMQVTDRWAVRDRSLARLHREFGFLASCFPEKVRVRHVPREELEDVDGLSRELHAEGPILPPPPKGRSLHAWQAAAVNVWWHRAGVRSAAILARVFDLADAAIDQIVTGKSYLDATFVGLPTYRETLDAGPWPTPALLSALGQSQE